MLLLTNMFSQQKIAKSHQVTPSTYKLFVEASWPEVLCMILISHVCGISKSVNLTSSEHNRLQVRARAGTQEFLIHMVTNCNETG